MEEFNPIIEVGDDGLSAPSVGIWSQKKYKLVGGYAHLFTKSMRKKWQQLVYIDLFAGSGYTKISGTNKILKTSPLIALSITTKFDKYIFCEYNEKKLNALRDRVKREFPDENVEFILGDSNCKANEIRDKIPKYSKDNKVLSFCFVDPYSLDLYFNTIRNLSQNLMDFLILHALHMDANRNLHNYISEHNQKIANFLGEEEWREKFRKSDSNLIKFLADTYDSKMKELNYLDPHRIQIRSNKKNLPLYYLSFYSRHQLGNKFIKDVEKYSDDQLNLMF